MTIQEKIAIMQAYQDGKNVEFYDYVTCTWKIVKYAIDYDFNFALYNYRIKETPKYRPFKDAKECWNEMQKHQPFGWIKPVDCDHSFELITYVDDYGIVCGAGACEEAKMHYAYKHYDDYEFIDGTRFGVMEE